MSVTYRNIFGRQGGRGWRPWVLLPKVFFAGGYLGGVAACTVLWLTRQGGLELIVMNQIRAIVLWLIVPSVIAAVTLGAILFLQHPRQFVRMRWMQVKLVSVAAAVPLSHLWLASRSLRLREALMQGSADEAAITQLGFGWLLAVLGAAWIILLGRLKPRFNQNYAQAYAASLAEER